MGVLRPHLARAVVLENGFWHSHGHIPLAGAGFYIDVFPLFHDEFYVEAGGIGDGLDDVLSGLFPLLVVVNVVFNMLEGVSFASCSVGPDGL